MIHNSVYRRLLGSLLAGFILLMIAPNQAVGGGKTSKKGSKSKTGSKVGTSTQSATSVQLTFQLLSAPHAALGAPMVYQLVLNNTGTTTVQVQDHVNLIAPNGTTYAFLATKPTLTAGQIKSTSGTFITSTNTSQLGAFTLHGDIADTSSGAILASTDLPLTVVAVPSNGVYGSVGGMGPDTASQGYTYDFDTVTANLTKAAMSLQTKSTLIETDGTEAVLFAGSLQTVNPGANIVTPRVVTTSQYTSKTGTFGVRVDVLDSTGTVLATETHNFTRKTLPTGYFPPSFTDTATTAGVNMPRSMMMMMPGCGGFPDFMMGGSGAAVADYDGDGNEDIFVVDEAMGMNHLWHNNGNGTYTDMAMMAGIPQGMMGMMASGASFADIDNDGHPDLLILYFGMENMLLHNNGDGTFTDITATAGINQAIPQNNFTATWGDYDNDGFLDLYIAVHADCMAMNQNDHLYHNNGNLTFTDVTSYLGGSTAAQVNGRGLTAAFVDYNQDGRVDLYVGNDEGAKSWSHPNVLWRNDGPDGKGGWIFTDVSSQTGAGVAMSAMGIAVGDYNRDGLYDLFVTNFGANVMLKNQSNATFVQEQGDGVGGAHVARATIPATAGGVGINVAWSTAFYDFNNDGWEDIYMAGSLMGGAGLMSRANGLLISNRDGTFLDLSVLSGTSGTSSLGSMPCAVFADFNNDGFMDVFQAPASGNIHLYMNNGIAQGNTYHWLQVKLIGTVSNRDAVGARVVASVGGVNLWRTVVNGGGYQGNSTLTLHFGLGSATQADTLTIYWPSGIVQTMTNVQGGQKLVVTEP